MGADGLPFSHAAAPTTAPDRIRHAFDAPHQWHWLYKLAKQKLHFRSPRSTNENIFSPLDWRNIFFGMHGVAPPT